MPCRECVYFLQEKELDILCFTEKQRKNLQRNRESSPTVKKEAGTIRNRRNGIALCHEKIKNQRKDFQHKLSRELAERYDAVCVEDLNRRECPEACILEKACRITGTGSFCPCLDTSWKSAENIL